MSPYRVQYPTAISDLLPVAITIRPSALAIDIRIEAAKAGLEILLCDRITLLEPRCQGGGEEIVTRFDGMNLEGDAKSCTECLSILQAVVTGVSGRHRHTEHGIWTEGLGGDAGTDRGVDAAAHTQ